MRLSLLVVHNSVQREQGLESTADLHRVFFTTLDNWSKIVTPPFRTIRVIQT